MNKVHVKASTKEYDVTIGTGLDVGSLLSEVHKICKIMLVSDDTVYGLYGKKTEDSLKAVGFEVFSFVFEHGEKSKNISVAEKLMIEMTEKGITKIDLLLALGGGVVGDLTGFAASVYLRGMDFVQVPTTLLAAVDSSVGGKTAVDLPNGKNLVGAFHQPVAVFCDVDSFQSLPAEIYSDGMAEAVKYGMIYDSDLFGQIENGTISDEDLVKRSVEIKAEVVEKDEFDKGPRHILNFGHTLGHAIETLSGYSIGHGSGVAMGMAVLGAVYLSEEDSARLNAVLKKYGLYNIPSYDIHETAVLAKVDKKAHGNLIRAVLPVAIGEVKLQDVTVEEWEEILRKGIGRLS